jgi:hypothetical protein
MLFGGMGWSNGLTYAAGRGVAALLIYISLQISGHIADRKFGRNRVGVTRRWNRNLGALGGALSGALLVVLLLFVLDAIVMAFPDGSGGFIESARSSQARRWISGINPAHRFMVTDVLKLLRVAQDDPERVRDLLSEHPTVQQTVEEVRQDAEVQRVLNDAELMAAIEEFRVGDILGNENLRMLLQDSELLRKLLSEEMRAAVRDVAAAAENAEEDEDEFEPE